MLPVEKWGDFIGLEGGGRSGGAPNQPVFAGTGGK